MPELGWLKRSWVRRDRENESYCRTCKTWKPNAEFNYRDAKRGLLQYEIGRASCRERVQISVVAVSLKKKKTIISDSDTNYKMNKKVKE